METAWIDLRRIQPFIYTVLKFLVEDTPTKKLPQTDAIFIFGHYEPRIAHHAAKLYKMGQAP